MVGALHVIPAIRAALRASAVGEVARRRLAELVDVVEAELIREPSVEVSMSHEFYVAGIRFAAGTYRLVSVPPTKPSDEHPF